jgi:hypothetical protein
VILTGVSGWFCASTAEFTSITGSFAYSTDYAPEGTGCMKVSGLGNTQNYGRVPMLSGDGSPVDHVLQSAYFSQYAYSKVICTDDSTTLWSFLNSSGSYKMHVMMNTAGKIEVRNSSGSVVATAANVLPDGWHCFQIKVGRGAGTTGQFAVYVDGDYANANGYGVSGTANLLNSVTARITCGNGYRATNATTTFTTYYSRALVDDADYHNDFNSIWLPAAGNGDYTAWTGDYTYLDDAMPHDSDTTKVYTGTQDACESVTVASCANADPPIGAILAVRPIAFVRCTSSTPTMSYGLRQNGTDDWSFDNAPSTSYVVRGQCYITQIDYETDWTTEALDAAQPVVKFTYASGEGRCTSMGLLAFYEPALDQSITDAGDIDSAEDISLQRVIRSGLPVTDDFNRAELGSEWTVRDGNVYIDGNDLFTGDEADNRATYNGTFPKDQYAQAVIAVLGSGDSLDLIVRYAVGRYVSYYYYSVSGDSADKLQYVANNTTGTLATGSAPYPTVGDTIRLEAAGSSIRVYVNGTLRHSVTNSAAVGPGNPGLHVISGMAFDDFEAGSLVQTCGPTGISTASALGSATLIPGLIHPTGVASVAAFGSARTILYLSPTAIGPGVSIGSCKLVGLIQPTGLASAEVIGTGKLVCYVQPNGVDSTESMGSCSVSCVIQPTGVDTDEHIGSTEVSQRTVLAVDGISTDESVGAPSVAVIVAVTLASIQSVTAFGAATVFFPNLLQPESIGTDAHIGTTVVRYRIGYAGLESEEMFGEHTVRVGVALVLPPSIDPGFAAGTCALHQKVTQAGAIGSTAAFGEHTVARGTLVLGVMGIVSGYTSGVVKIAWRQIVGLTAIASAESFGAVVVGVWQVVEVEGVETEEHLGSAWVTPQQFVAATGIVSLAACAEPNILQAIKLQSIATEVAVSAPVVQRGGVDLSPNGITSAESVSGPTFYVYQSVEPVGISTGQTVGSVSIIPRIGFPGLESTEEFGDPSVLVGVETLLLDGIETGEGFGTVAVSASCSTTGIATEEAFGTGTITTRIVLVLQQGIASGTIIGSTIIKWQQFIASSAIISAEHIGTVIVGIQQTLDLEGVESGETVAEPVVLVGEVLDLDGIEPAEAFGGPSLVQVVHPSGLAAGACGSPTVIPGSVAVSPNAISSLESIGSSSVHTYQYVQPDSIESAEDTGDVVVRHRIGFPGIESELEFGDVTVLRGTISCGPTGIATQEASGEPQMGWGLHPAGITTSFVVGPITLATGPVEVEASGIPSGQSVGTPTLRLTWKQSLDLTGIATQEALGACALHADYLVTSTSIGSLAALGAPTAFIGCHIDAIVSEETIGSLALFVQCHPVAIASVGAMGTPTCLVGCHPSAIESVEDFGEPEILCGGVSIDTPSIVSEECLGDVRVIHVIGCEGTESSVVLSEPALVVGPVTVAPDSIDSGFDSGAHDVLPGGVEVDPEAIASAEDHGEGMIVSIITAVGVSSEEVFGGQSILPGGISVIASAIISEESSGSPTLFLEQLVDPSGIEAIDGYGEPTLWQEQLVDPNGLASCEAIGDVVLRYRIGYPGIESEEAFGDTQLSVGPVTVDVSGFEDTVFGDPHIVLYLLPDAMSSEETTGVPACVVGEVVIAPDGLESVGEIPSPLFHLFVGGGDIDSSEAVGTASVVQDVSVTGVVAGEGVGSPTIQCGGVTVACEAAASSEQIGDLRVVLCVGPDSIDSGQAAGEPSVSCGEVLITDPDIIWSMERVPSPVVLRGGVSLDVDGIESAEACGAPGCTTIIRLHAEGIVSGESCGEPVIVRLLDFVLPGGIYTEEIFERPHISVHLNGKTEGGGPFLVTDDFTLTEDRPGPGLGENWRTVQGEPVINDAEGFSGNESDHPNAAVWSANTFHRDQSVEAVSMVSMGDVLRLMARYSTWGGGRYAKYVLYVFEPNVREVIYDVYGDTIGVIAQRTCPGEWGVGQTFRMEVTGSYVVVYRTFAPDAPLRATTTTLDAGQPGIGIVGTVSLLPNGWLDDFVAHELWQIVELIDDTNGIPTAEAVGTPRCGRPDAQIQVESIVGQETVAQPDVAAAYTVVCTSIDSVSAFGRPSISGGHGAPVDVIEDDFVIVRTVCNTFATLRVATDDFVCVRVWAEDVAVLRTLAEGFGIVRLVREEFDL